MSRAIITVGTMPGRKGWWVMHHLLALPYGRKADAITQARTLAAMHHLAGGGLAQIVVRGRMGLIQTEWTYGSDPSRTPG